MGRWWHGLLRGPLKNTYLQNPLLLLKFACVGGGESFQLFWVAGSRNIKTRYDNYLHPRLSCSPRSATWFVYFFEQKGNSHSQSQWQRMDRTSNNCVSFGNFYSSHQPRYVLTDSSFNTIYDRELDLLCLEHKKISEDEN